MMKHYNIYKDSLVGWMGKIPENWIIAKLKHIVDMKSGNFISSDMIEDEGLYPIYGGNGIRCYHSQYTHEGYFALVGRQGALCGNINYTNGRFWPTEHAVVVSPKKKVNTFWIGEVLRLMNLNQYSQASAQPGLSVDKILNLLIPIPSFEEQTQIARYLDHQTNIVDQLIHQKVKLMELLKEKRQSVINEAVTKGLKPNAKMKDSGIEWLGEVPQEWAIVKLKHVLEMKSGNFISAEMIEDEGPYPVYGGNGIRGYHSDYTHEGFFPLVGRQGALCGNINYANGKFWPTEHAVVVLPKKQVDTYWIGELLRMMNLNQYSQASAQPGLAVEKILNLRILLPTFEEQKQIAIKLKSLDEKFELTKKGLVEGITKLKEYRQSIISEAVTGKIDVRDWQPDKTKTTIP